MQQCTSCGATLPSEANNCPTCGAPTYTIGPFQETVSISPATQPDRPLRTEPYQPGYFQEASSVQPYYASYVNPQQSTYATPPQAFPPLQQPQVRRKNALSPGMMLAIVVAALLIMFSGLGLIYYSTVYHPAQLRMQATSTAQTLQTQAALANAQATGTAVAYANATSTVQAIATANAVATATALQNIYTTATNGMPILNDSLAYNTGSGWDEGRGPGGGGCAFSNGAYHASLDQKGHYFICIAQNTNFSNFAFQVQMSIVRGDAGGLIFRANSSALKFYFLSVGQDGTYYIAAFRDQHHSTEIDYGQSSAFKKGTGQSNLLTLIARGKNMYLYIDKQFAGSISDGTYTSGQVGFIVDSQSTSTEVAFNNAQVWNI